jgi:hypothetical protein
MPQREFACTECMWTGNKPEKDKCPICDSDIEPVMDGAIWEYYDGDYAWNKK